MNLSDMAKYHNEYSTIRKTNGKLHADVCLLRQQGANEAEMDVIRAEIHANERRMNTIEYLLRWIRENAEN